MALRSASFFIVNTCLKWSRQIENFNLIGGFIPESCSSCNAFVLTFQSWDTTSISLTAGCDLFMRYVTRTSALEFEDFNAAKSRVLGRAEKFGEISYKVSSFSIERIGCIGEKNRRRVLTGTAIFFSSPGPEDYCSA